MSEENNFTQEQVDEAINNAKNEWIENELNPVVNERDDLLQHKPKEQTDEEKAIAEKEQDLWKKEVNISLKENGLEQFASIIKVNDEDELKETVKQLSQIKNDIKVENGYVPKEHAKEDEYSKYEKENDVSGMIGTKLSKLFK